MRALLLAVAFSSGLASLVYQVLWMRHLRSLLGSGALAAAAALAIFFAGMAIGNALLGRRAARSDSPLGLYAGLEIGVAATALLAFAVPGLAHALDPAHASSPSGMVVRSAVAFALLLPPAVLLGGSLPVLAEAFVQDRGSLAKGAGTLYAVHGLGAGCGALLAGFILPSWLGFTASYGATIGLNLTLAALAWLAAGRIQRRAVSSEHSLDGTRVPVRVLALAFSTGAAALALEVLATRMFALVLNSSVYAFSAVLVTFLVAVSLGAALSVRLVDALPRELHLFSLLLGAGLAVGICPFVLHWATGQLGSLPLDWGFLPYLTLTFATLAIVILPPATLGAGVLPSLLRFVDSDRARPGAAFGELLAANTGGGVVGSLLAGFVLLPSLGLWRSVTAVAFVYLGAGVLAVRARSPAARFLRPAALLCAILLGTFLDPTRLALVRVEGSEVPLRTWETVRGIVTVTEDQAGRRIRLDNTYVLGGTEGRTEEAFQAALPLALHPAPRRVFVLGLGSGLTAAAALQPEVERLTVTELLPEVVEASRLYFAPDTARLFTDDRSRVLAVDGRAHLAAHDETWDLVLSDLFLPWQDGAGRLYSRDHFETVRRRLAPGGRFAQWLPLFQLTRPDFLTIVHTLLDVFGELEIWEVDFRGGSPIALLITGTSDTPSPAPPARRVARLSRPEPPRVEIPLQTDDHPVLEYRAPVARARVRAGDARWLVGREWEALLSELSR